MTALYFWMIAFIATANSSHLLSDDNLKFKLLNLDNDMAMQASDGGALPFLSDGSAIKSQGDMSYIIPKTTTLNIASSQGITIAAIVRFDNISSGADGGWERIFDMDGGPGTYANVVMGRYSQTNNLVIQIADETTGGSQCSTMGFADAIIVGKWSIFIVTANPTNLYTVYNNGATHPCLEAYSFPSGRMFEHNRILTKNYIFSSPFSDVHPTTGTLAGLLVFDRSLHHSEVMELTKYLHDEMNSRGINIDVDFEQLANPLPAIKPTGSLYRLPNNWFNIVRVPFNKPIRYLEIGVYEGLNLLLAAKTYARHPHSELHGIDPWIDYNQYPEYKGQQESTYQTFLNNLEKSPEKDKIIIHRGFSHEEIPKFPDSYFDIVFIDGNHEPDYVLEDAVLSLRKLKPGGYMIFDDYGWAEQSSNSDKGIDAFLTAVSSRVKVLGIRNTQCFVQKLHIS